MGLFSSIAKIAAPVIGALSGAQGQSSANRANIAQSKEQMDFQREMSNTSYQRGVADMRKAGLNPMLAYTQGGASTPSGTKADIGNVTKAGIEAASSAAQLSNVQSQTELNETNAAKSLAEAEKIRAETDFTKGARTDLTKEQTNKIGYENAKILADTQLSQSNRGLVIQQIKNAIETNKSTIALTSNTKANTALTRINKMLRSTELAGARNTQKFDEATGSGKPSQRMLIELLKLWTKK